MPATRSSARQAAGAASNSSPTASQSKEIEAGTSGTKRKGAPTATPKAKRGKKGNKKEQTTIEQSMPQDEAQDVEMKDKDEEKPEVTTDNDNGKETKDGDEDPTSDPKKVESVAEETATTSQGDKKDKDKTGANGVTGEESAKVVKDSEAKGEVTNGDSAVESSSKREDSTPSSILEKGIFYFFERGRVGIDEPSKPDEIARSYIVLRPLPHGAKLGDGPIGDGGNNRLLALPKKVLPKSPKDRFMSFVEKANASMDEIKTNFGASDYATKTSGTRHSPPMAPLGEGVYAIISNGREVSTPKLPRM